MEKHGSEICYDVTERYYEGGLVAQEAGAKERRQLPGSVFFTRQELFTRIENLRSGCGLPLDRFLNESKLPNIQRVAVDVNSSMALADQPLLCYIRRSHLCPLVISTRSIM